MPLTAVRRIASYILGCFRPFRQEGGASRRFAPERGDGCLPANAYICRQKL